MFAQFRRFLIVGVVNTFTGLMVIFAAKWSMDLGDVSANVIGYAVGLAVSYVLNKKWTFRHKGEVLRSFLWFIATFAIAYPLNLATVIVLIHGAETNSYLAQALGIPPYMITFYLFSRYLSFRQRRESGDTKIADARATGTEV